MGCLFSFLEQQVTFNLDDKKLPGTVEFTDVPDDQYLCPVEDCDEIPEIIDVFSDYGYIKMKCKTHNIIKCSIKEFYKKTKKKIII